jgi:hypothetical protein
MLETATIRLQPALTRFGDGLHHVVATDLKLPSDAYRRFVAAVIDHPHFHALDRHADRSHWRSLPGWFKHAVDTEFDRRLRQI